ncbi:MAG: hypothetical protein KDC47_07605 [Flavobacteriaceae bacterium]|nr:hypothetical protein [Flavobacteriaceae bacterium]
MKLSILTWNLGYAGLGKESNFIVDGGWRLFPPSKKIVEKNLIGIKTFIASNPSDVILFQEITKCSPLNFWVKMLDLINASLKEYESSFECDMYSRYLPSLLKPIHGSAIYSKYSIKESEKVILSQPLNTRLTFIEKLNHLHYVLIFDPISDKKLIIGNIHLPAFDRDAELRFQQLNKIMDFARQKHQEGFTVIIGGDWNLKLSNKEFAHETPEKYLFWIHDFPYSHLPKDWSLTYDPKTPTVRTNQRRYTEGINFRTIIDGFLCSPNVKILDIDTADLSFQYTDHHPVKLTITI